MAFHYVHEFCYLDHCGWFPKRLSAATISNHSSVFCHFQSGQCSWYANTVYLPVRSASKVQWGIAATWFCRLTTASLLRRAFKTCFLLVAVHAAVIAINEALDVGDSVATMKALRNPNACLTGLEGENEADYQNRLLESKKAKAEAARNKVVFSVPDIIKWRRLPSPYSMQLQRLKISWAFCIKTFFFYSFCSCFGFHLYSSFDDVFPFNRRFNCQQVKDKPEDERDMYEELLTHAEIQGNVTKINCESLQKRRDSFTSVATAPKLFLPLREFASALRAHKQVTVIDDGRYTFCLWWLQRTLSVCVAKIK